MSMSAKSRALFTADRQSDWNKYKTSMQTAYNEWQEEQQRAATAESKRSGWTKALGTIAIILETLATAGAAAPA